MDGISKIIHVHFSLEDDNPYDREVKQLAQSALQSELGEELPPISSKEAAEVIAKAAVQGIQGSCTL